MPKQKIYLQIVSEGYKKQPHIQIPTAWLVPKLRLHILKMIQVSLRPIWQAREKKFTGKWVPGLKCHPAANIEVFNAEESLGLLLLYPQDYRGLIEDPLAEDPPPITYLGSIKRVAFYYYHKSKVTANSALIDKLVMRLKLKKS